MIKKRNFEGYLNIGRNHPPTLWSIPFDKNREFYRFPEQLVKKHGLPSGVRVKCVGTGNTITEVISICGVNPDVFAQRKKFEQLIPSNPTEKFNFGSSPNPSVRILDLFTPIGKGTRGLIVSPPRAGKTMLLEALANEFNRIDPNLKVIVLLIDERPEEVTSFINNTKAHVFHSSLDKGSSSHILLSQFLFNHIKLEIECGNDVVLLLDSLTRMSRAYNTQNHHSHKTMSGGLGSGALELPRKLFGIARNVVNGGSCTVLATILKDTGSRMDEVIFQEFKGTGNCEVILDRDIAEERIFPALHIAESGTRKDELLHSPADMIKINQLRRKLLQQEKSKAISTLLELMENYKNNQDLLQE